jgi:hypothetical protein
MIFSLVYSGPVKPKTASVISPAQMEVRKRLEAVIDRPKKLRFHLDPERLKKLKVRAWNTF